MSTNLGWFVSVWAVLAAGVIVLALYRLTVDKNDYTVLHVRRSELSLIPQQVLRAEKLDIIDRWGKILTVVAIAYGLAIAVGYLYLSLH